MKEVIVYLTKERLQFLIDELDKPEDERQVLMLEKIVEGVKVHSIIIVGVEDDGNGRISDETVRPKEQESGAQ